MNFDGTEDLRELYLAEIRAERQAVRLMMEAVMEGDAAKFAQAFSDAHALLVLPRAFRGLDGLSAPPDLRMEFLSFWESHGNSIRSSCDDLSLLTALKALLPIYTGPGLMLYRGCGWSNRVRRTYGLSWTPRVDVARAFAGSRKDMYQEGSVLLEAYAPLEAIISAPALFTDRYDEAEYVVDRRKLKGVKVLERMKPKEAK